MVMDLLVPRPRLIVPKPKSYIKLDMAMDGASDSYLFDKSRYRSHGTITGASWATGLHGKALDFNKATPDYVSIPATHTQLDLTSEDLSIVMRFYADSLTGEQFLLCRGLFNVDGWRFQSAGPGWLLFRVNQAGSSQYGQSDANVIGTDAWYTIGCTRVGAQVTFYSNGVNAGGPTGAMSNPLTSARALRIGVADDLATAPFDGKIEFCRIFKGIALSASEHLAYHNALK